MNIAPKFISMKFFEILLFNEEDCHPMNIPQGKHQQCTQGFTPFQVEHHMRTTFATPILHAIDNFKKLR